LKGWADFLGGVPFPLLSDFWPHGAVGKAYGIFNEERGIDKRAAYVIDAKGIIRYAKVYPQGTIPDQRRTARRAEKAVISSGVGSVAGRSLFRAAGSFHEVIAGPHLASLIVPSSIEFVLESCSCSKCKNAVVTGSTGGIGLGVATALATRGVNVMLNGFGEPAAIKALCARLAKEHGVRVEHHGADMSKPADIGAMMRQAESSFGTVDILVNNAGIQFVSPIEDFPPEKWDAIIAINLVALFHTIRHTVPGMKKRRWGRIINIASAHALVASPFKSAYVAAKHGVAGLTIDCCPRNRDCRNYLQRDLPRLCADAVGRKTDSGYGKGARHH